MVKVAIGGIRVDNGIDDCNDSDDEDTKYCIISLDDEIGFDEDDDE
jgi:hypothetical protein